MRGAGVGVFVLMSELELLLLSRSASDEANLRECTWPTEGPEPAGELDRMRIGADAACGGGGGGVSLLKTRLCDEG